MFQVAVHGFCYYHYWFNGRRILERPFDEVLTTGAPDFPFCLCWANENWTRAWDGRSGENLLVQHYSQEDDLLHIRWLAKVFQDKRYIRVNGKPIFLVYRSSLLPNPLMTTTLWREEAIKLGVGEWTIGFQMEAEKLHSSTSVPVSLLCNSGSAAVSTSDSQSSSSTRASSFSSAGNFFTTSPRSKPSVPARLESSRIC